MTPEEQLETQPFVCRYFHDGAWWGLTVHAYDWQDAEARCKKLGVVLDGELVANVPASFGFLAKFACRLRSVFHQL